MKPVPYIFSTILPRLIVSSRSYLDYLQRLNQHQIVITVGLRYFLPVCISLSKILYDIQWQSCCV